MRCLIKKIWEIDFSSERTKSRSLVQGKWDAREFCWETSWSLSTPTNNLLLLGGKTKKFNMAGVEEVKQPVTVRAIVGLFTATVLSAKTVVKLGVF